MMEQVLAAGVYGGALALAGLCLRWGLRTRLPRRTFVLFWIAAAFRMLLPLPVSSGWSVYRWLLPDRAPAADTVVTVQAGLTPGQAVAPAVLPPQLLPAVWVGGMLAAILVLTLLYLRTRRMLRLAIPVRGAPALERLLQGRRVRVYTCEGLGTPLTSGILRPRIYLPAGMKEALVSPPGPAQELLRHAMAHELAHIRGRDNLWKLLALAAACLHWFNPLAWILAAMLARDLELCCDERVLQILGGGERAGYAMSLIQLAQSRGRLMPLRSCFGLNAVEERIKGIMGFKRRRFFWRAVPGIVTALAFALFATAPSPGPGVFATESGSWSSRDEAVVASGREESIALVNSVEITGLDGNPVSISLQTSRRTGDVTETAFEQADSPAHAGGAADWAGTDAVEAAEKTAAGQESMTFFGSRQELSSNEAVGTVVLQEDTGVFRQEGQGGNAAAQPRKTANSAVITEDAQSGSVDVAQAVEGTNDTAQDS